jgi:hypothetical protein
MEEQISIIITILAALLTGGFLMIFIESQKVAGDVTERFHFVMNPFFHSFSNYAKFISSFRHCFEFNCTDEFLTTLKENVETVGRLGTKSIMAGRDFPSDYFTAKELDRICRTISNIWYRIDRESHHVDRHLNFDSDYAETSCQHTKEYLTAIHPKYANVPLTKDLLETVSGDFFDDIYQPVQNILPHYERWQCKEKEFKWLALTTVAFTLLTMVLIVLFSCYIQLWVFQSLCVICCGLLIFELYKLIKLENLSKKIMR